jgi:hypothetical protein
MRTALTLLLALAAAPAHAWIYAPDLPRGLNPDDFLFVKIMDLSQAPHHGIDIWAHEQPGAYRVPTNHQFYIRRTTPSYTMGNWDVFTVRTSIRSKWRSPNSRAFSAPPPSAMSKVSNDDLANSWNASTHANAAITFGIADMQHTNLKTALTFAVADSHPLVQRNP